MERTELRQTAFYGKCGGEAPLTKRMEVFMATYNRITPEIARQLKAVVGERRFFTGEDIDPNYSHDEMPIYGKYMPDAAVDVETTEEVSEIMKICSANKIPVTCRGAGTGLVGIVTEVGKNYAKVQSIISDESSVSAMSLSTSDTCVVKGNTEKIQESGMIDVKYISKDAEMKSGDELVTSHISSRYLQGLRIGTVSDIKIDSTNLTKSAQVTPVVDFQHIKQVLVILELKEVPKDADTVD